VRIASWNVNGLRACARKGFLSWLEEAGADIVGVQEVRATLDQLPDSLRVPRGWHVTYASAERKGYSGVGLFSRRAPDAVETSLGAADLDREGRVQLVRRCHRPRGEGRPGWRIAADVARAAGVELPPWGSTGEVLETIAAEVGAFSGLTEENVGLLGRRSGQEAAAGA